MFDSVQIDIYDGPAIWCGYPDEMSLHNGDYCIVEHDGCLEYGRAVAFRSSEKEGHGCSGARVLRRATLQDKSKASESNLRGRMARETCEAKALELGLEVRLVRVRYSFDRAVLFVVFTSDKKVDSKEYAKALSSELRCQVKASQIGVRDEAGIIGGIGPCGRELCCCSWLDRFSSINVKMAKKQRMSLSPASIGGCCGRLKCCLKYEYDTYRELDKFLPRQGSKVHCPEGKGEVVDKEIMRQTVTVKLEDDRIVEYRGDEVHRNWGLEGGRRKHSGCPENKEGRQGQGGTER
jgi:cell fate regulator YaaT (PSP1 superfamily)